MKSIKRARFLFLCVPLLACGESSSQLSEVEATRIIRQTKGYPLLVYLPVKDGLGIKPSSPLGREIDRLVTEGYLIESRAPMSSHSVTEKGKGLIRKVYWNSVHDEFTVFQPYTHIADVKGIIETLVDPKNNIARVTYEVGYSPTEYLTRLTEIDPRVVKQNLGTGPRSRRAQMLLKKWGQGWRPM